jgi:hypothetical protein
MTTRKGAVVPPIEGFIGDTDEDVILGTFDGQAVLVPRSVRNANPTAQALLADIQAASRHLVEVSDEIDVLVQECRQWGVSWSAVAFVTGMTPQGARQRFGT